MDSTQGFHDFVMMLHSVTAPQMYSDHYSFHNRTLDWGWLPVCKPTTSFVSMKTHKESECCGGQMPTGSWRGWVLLRESPDVFGATAQTRNHLPALSSVSEQLRVHDWSQVWGNTRAGPSFSKWSSPNNVCSSFGPHGNMPGGHILLTWPNSNDLGPPLDFRWCALV